MNDLHSLNFFLNSGDGMFPLFDFIAWDGL